MILPLTLAPQPSPGAPALPSALARLGSSELFLLELQGELEVSGEQHGQLVGRLTIDDDGKGKPTLRIGHHLMEGKIVSLPKPLAVLQRVCAPSVPSPPTTTTTTTTDGEVDLEGDVEMRHSSGDASASDRDAGDDNDDSVPARATSYAIRTLIRKKIVFSKRPTPIVGLSAKIA